MGKAYVENEKQHWKLQTPIKTRFVSKIIMFEETLEFHQVTLLCYKNQNILNL